MSTATIPNHYPEVWDTGWVSALQTADQRFSGAYSPDTATGDRKWYNIGGTIAFKRRTERYPETTHVDYSTGKSWLVPEPWDAPVLFDKWDQAFLDSIVLPTSRVMLDQAAAYNRLRDEFVKNAIQGTRTTGATGGTTETFPTGNVVAVDADDGSTDTGLTWYKIRHTKKLMDDLRVPMTERYFAIGPAQVQDLMNMAQATDRDYATTALIREGQIHGTLWAGFNWIEYPDLDFDSGDADARQCLAFYKPDIVLAETGMKTYMDVLPTRSHALQIRPDVMLGSCRINNSAIIVKCLEA